MQAVRPYRVSLVGGDTSASRRGLFLNIMLTGVVKPRQALLRSGAGVGDRLYVTGTLGDSHAGLKVLTKRTRGGRTILPPPQVRWLLARHHRPSARVAEGRWLVKHALATAAIDVSDGLSGDLRHLCEESGVGADIVAGSLPALSGLSGLCGRTASRSHGSSRCREEKTMNCCSRFLSASSHDSSGWQPAAPFRFTCIGSITPRRSGLRIRSDDGAFAALPITSYEHFLRPSS